MPLELPSLFFLPDEYAGPRQLCEKLMMCDFWTQGSSIGVKDGVPLRSKAIALTCADDGLNISK